MKKGEFPIHYIKCIASIIIAFLLCTTALPQIQPVPVKAAKLSRPLPLIQFIVGQLIFMFNPPISFAEGYKAFPANITIGVNERLVVRVGNINTSSGEIEPSQDWFFFTDRFLTFSSEVLGGNPGGVWFINFDPPTVSIKSSQFLATNVTISLTSPPMASQHIQDTIIRIHIADTWVIKNLWWPEDKAYHLIGENFTIPGEKWSLFYNRPMWFLAALFGGFGKNSGKILTDPYYVDILVKVKPFHFAKIQALPPSKLTPNEIISIPILVENQGNYNDTFDFKIRTETGYPLTLTNNGSITLKPGEQGQAYVGIAAPPNLLDTGTLHSIFIDTYSAFQPNVSIATQRIFLETQGIYFSEQNSTFVIGFGLIVLLGIILFFNWRRKTTQKTSKKPEKPWKIPEERQHLSELKRMDKNAFEQERIMMEDEYKSAMLWYKDNRKQSRITPTKGKRQKLGSSVFKKLTLTLKTAGKLAQKQKRKKEQPALLKKPKKENVKSHISIEDSAKEKILAKIRWEQERQLRKLQ